MAKLGRLTKYTKPVFEEAWAQPHPVAGRCRLHWPDSGAVKIQVSLKRWASPHWEPRGDIWARGR